MTDDLQLGVQGLSTQLVATLRAKIAEERLVLLRQADIEIPTGEARAAAHVALARALGDDGLEDRFAAHPQSPHPLLFRVSNDQRHGVTGVGISGWHVDGTHKLKPQLLHTFQCVSAVDDADTFFVPLDLLFEAQPEEVQKYWSSLWVRTGRGIVHPFVHVHPSTGRPALCLFMGSHLVSFTANPHCANPMEQVHIIESDVVHRKVEEAIAAAPHLVYRHKWKAGDFLIHDNLATAHLASPETQVPPAQSGLRVLDRAAVLSKAPLVAFSGGGESFVDLSERRAYLAKLWHSPVREGMTPEQLDDLRKECQRVGLDMDVHM